MQEPGATGSKDCSRFNVGDLVEISVEPSALQTLQREHGGLWGNMMQHLRDVGIVCDVLGDGDVMVRFGDKGPFIFNPDILTKVLLGDSQPAGKSEAAKQNKEPAHSAKPQCTICLIKEASGAIVPCGHVACCSDCVKRLKICPICRSKIASYIHIFIP
ncbi:unnamed protein product [Lymnaea stagnalis]|uniref:RING-type domain-containing protein n=1 Tax=Lymnaea stagnalis TaxID=6523 RepID=A0AAV2IB43_LYMST